MGVPSRFQRLSDADYSYRQIAQTSLGAAEEFGSLRLLDVSESAIRALQGRLDVLGARTVSAEERSNLEGDEVMVTELRMRAAVLRADLTRSDADIEIADTLIRSADRPHFLAAAEVAYSGGGSFCDIGTGLEGNAEAVEQACQDDHLFAERAIGYWRNRAMLDLVMGAPTKRSDELAMRLLEQEQSSGGGRCCGFNNPSDLLRLRLMLSDYYRRKSADPVTGGELEAYQAWQLALDYLEQASRMAPPFEAPARFRRIAERWLLMWSHSDAMRKATGDGDLPASLYRHASYLRKLLPHLDAIAAGAE